MRVTACNINTWTNPKFRLGGPCNPDPALRKAALDEVLKGVEICKLMKISVLSVWPGSDGADYHFQIDYKQSIEWFTEALIAVNKECLKHGIKLAIEPKPYEPRELYMIIPTAASAILVAQQVNKAVRRQQLRPDHRLRPPEDGSDHRLDVVRSRRVCRRAGPQVRHQRRAAGAQRSGPDVRARSRFPSRSSISTRRSCATISGYYSQDQFTYREDPTRAIERSMINFANLALKAVRICRAAAAARSGARRGYRSRRARRGVAGAGWIDVTGSGTVTWHFAVVSASSACVRVADFATHAQATVDGPRLAPHSARRCQMPRPLRFLPAGSVHHIVNRGNDKRTLFESPRDYEEFLRLMAWAKHRANVRIPAYILIRNHWHFVLWPSAEGQVEAFQHLLDHHSRHSLASPDRNHRARSRLSGSLSRVRYLGRPALFQRRQLRRRQRAASRPWSNRPQTGNGRASMNVRVTAAASLTRDPRRCRPTGSTSSTPVSRRKSLDEIRSSLKKW